MNIEISTKSWHYRMCSVWLDFFNKSPANSLCVYFWQVMLSPVVFVFGLTLILLAIVSILFGMFYLPGMMVNILLTHLHILPAEFMEPKAGFNYRAIPMSLVVDAVCAVVMFIRYRSYKRSENTWGTDSKKPNLVLEYIKAKKAKICPIIKFK